MPQVLGDTATRDPGLLEFTNRYLDSLDGAHIVIEVEVEYRRVGGATPGVAAIIGTVFAVFGSLPISVTSVRFIAGTHTWSQHAYGNAVDFGVSGATHRRLAYFLDANRGPLRIAHLLADPYFPSPRNDHGTHVHVDPFPQYGGTPPGHPI